MQSQERITGEQLLKMSSKLIGHVELVKGGSDFSVAILSKEDALTDKDVIPGFQCRVTELFE